MTQGTDAVPTTDAESSYIRLGGVDVQRPFSTLGSGRGPIPVSISRFV